MKAICPSCRTQFHLAEKIGGKVGGLLVVAALGGDISKHPIGVLFGTLLGTYVGHQIDKVIDETCPHCGRTLATVETIVAAAA